MAISSPGFSVASGYLHSRKVRLRPPLSDRSLVDRARAGLQCSGGGGGGYQRSLICGAQHRRFTRGFRWGVLWDVDSDCCGGWVRTSGRAAAFLPATQLHALKGFIAVAGWRRAAVKRRRNGPKRIGRAAGQPPTPSLSISPIVASGSLHSWAPFATSTSEER